MMPQLSDSMDEGKLISWKIKVNDRVRMGDVIAEVESDKAIMEVQSFKNGVVLALYIDEGEMAPVGTVIATLQIETDASSASTQQNRERKTQAPQEVIPKTEVKVKKEVRVPRVKHTLSHGAASPKAKALAADYGLDIESLQKSMHLPVPAHENDINVYHRRRFFTPKALRLIERYALETNLFDLSKKNDTQDVLSYIQMHGIPLSKPIDSFQKALIKTVESALNKPVYHVYDHIDAALLEENRQYSMTVWLIKLFARAMMDFEEFRSVMTEEGIQIWPNASISVAMAKGSLLYMPVFKDANNLSLHAIEEKLREYQEKIVEESLSSSQMQGSSFGISNLGMTGIESFDAIINRDDSAIAAIGSSIRGKIAVTLTIDHRLINGYEAALFMQKIKSLSRDRDFFRGV